MRVFRIIMLVLLSIVDIFFLYSTIGYIIIAINTPKLIGTTTTIFTGSYIMSIMYLGFTLIATLLITLVAIRLKRSSK